MGLKTYTIACQGSCRRWSMNKDQPVKDLLFLLRADALVLEQEIKERALVGKKRTSVLSSFK